MSALCVAAEDMVSGDYKPLATGHLILQKHQLGHALKEGGDAYFFLRTTCTLHEVGRPQVRLHLHLRRNHLFSKRSSKMANGYYVAVWRSNITLPFLDRA